jgi:protein-disulfide isomerase
MKTRLISLIAMCLAASPLAVCTATVEWSVLQTLKTGEPPLALAVSPGGGRVFVLTEKREVLIYSPEGVLQERIAVGQNVDGIQAGPRDDVLFLVSRKDATIQLVTLDFIQEIPLQGSPYKGSRDARVSIAVFSDFQCPYCARLPALLDQVLERNPKDVKLVFKHYPLKSHAFAQQAALAAGAADRQGKFWEYHDALFKNMGALSEEKLQELARGLNLDMERFNKDLKDPKIQEAVFRDVSDGNRAGVRGTPTVFVNGRLVKNRSPEGFQALIDAELKKAEPRSGSK